MLSVTARPTAVSLSPRELQVLELLRAGLTSKEIAGHLAVSYWTVRTHIDRARGRYGARTLPELLARHARAQGRAREEPRTT